MENNPRTIAEQQEGRLLYHKLRVDFQEELREGKIVGEDLEGLPGPTIENYKVGLAFEAMRENDFGTAEAFFDQLGEEYSDLREHAEKKFLADMTKQEDEKQKNLLEKIEGIVIPKVKFAYAQERILNIAERNSLINELRNGEIRLSEVVEGYQKELEELQNLKEEEFVTRVRDYQIRLGEVLGAINEFSGRPIEFNQNLESCRVSKLRKSGGRGLLLTTPLTVIGGAFLLSAIMGPAAPVGAFLLAAGGLTCGAFAQLGKGANMQAEEDNKGEGVKIAFDALERNAKKIDSAVHKAFITDVYLKDSEVFKATFEKMQEDEHRHVIRQLLKKESRNEEADAWLEENYAPLIEEEGGINLIL